MHTGRPEATIAFLTVLSLYLLGRARNGNLWLYFGAGLSATLASDCHPPSGVVALGGFAGVCGYRFFCAAGGETLRRWKVALYASLGVAVGMAWWVGVHILPHPTIFFEQVRSRSHEQTPVWKKPQQIIQKEFVRYRGYFWNSRYHRNMVILIFLLSGTAVLIRNFRRKEHAELLLFFLGTTVALALIAVNTPAYYLIGNYPVCVW